MSDRTRAWLKLKCRPRDEFLIGGYSQPQGSRVGLGALLLGSFEKGEFVYRGRVGTGLKSGDLQCLRERLAKLETPHRPFATKPPRHFNRSAVHWVKPQLVAEIDYAEITAQGIIRQGSFVALRSDKPSREITKPPPAVVVVDDAVTRDRAKRSAAKRTNMVKQRAKGFAADRVEVAGVAITNADRVIPDSGGATKLDAVRYYERVADWLRPQITPRLVSLIKCPGGDFGHCFFQRHPFEPARGKQKVKGDLPCLQLHSLTEVIAAVQNGAFEFHTWGSRAAQPHRPDRITLDLDPDPKLSWSTLRDGCELVRTLLDELELQWFIKTTGGKGIHFVLPLQRRHTWDEVKDFSRGLAEHLAKTLPSLFIANMSKQRRRGLIYVDYLRNAETATAVAAYSMRARAGLPISMPIAWNEMKQDVRGAYFNLRNVPEILETRRHDPWGDHEAASQQISASAKRAVGVH